MKKLVFILLLLFPSFAFAQQTRSSLTATNNADFYACGNGCIKGTVLNSYNSLIISSFGNLSDPNTWTGVNSFGGATTFNGSVTFNGTTTGVMPSASAISSALGGTPELVFNVADYGAKCDNSTDDTAAINSAISAWRTAGQNYAAVLVGPAKGDFCKVTSPLNFTNTLATSGPYMAVRDLYIHGVYQSALPIGTVSITAGGTGGTSGTYTNVALTGGSGSGCTASSITVSGGAVTSIVLPVNGCGSSYKSTDTGLSASSGSIGNVSGFTTKVNSLSGGAIVDALGSIAVHWENVNIVGDCSSVPNAGMAIGRTSTAVADRHYLGDVKITGCFQFSSFYNNASETVQADHLEAFNSQASGITYAVVQDGANHFNWSSSFQTVSAAVDTVESFNENVFVSLDARTNLNASGIPIFMSGTARHRFYGSYAASSNYCAELFSPNGSTFNVYPYFDLHCETTSTTDAFYIDGANASPLIDGLTYIDHKGFYTNSIFKTASGVTSPVFRDLDVEVDSFFSGTPQLFASPSVWTASFRRIELPSSSDYTAPGTLLGGGFICFANVCSLNNYGSTFIAGASQNNAASWHTVAQSFFIGQGAGSAFPFTTPETFGSVGIGTGALQSLASISGEDTALGALAAQFETGGQNTCLGMHSCGSDTSQPGNTAAGNDALRDAITSTGYVTAIGQSALAHGNPGSAVAIGSQAARGNSSAVILGGTLTNGDVITITVAKSGSSPSNLVGFPISAAHTVAGGDTLASIATALASQLNQAAYGPSYYILSSTFAQSDGTQAIYLNFPGNATTGWALTTTAGVTGSATETTSVVTGTVVNTASVFVGSNAGFGAAAGTLSNDVVVGGNAAESIETASQLTAVGSSVASSITTGANDSLFGYNAGQNLTTGSQDTFIGDGAAENITVGSYGTALGWNAGVAQTTVSNPNLMLGAAAGYTYPTTGGGNVIISSGVGVSCNTDAAGTNNEIVICAGAGPALKITGAGTPSTSVTAVPGSLTVAGTITLPGPYSAAGTAAPTCNSAAKGEMIYATDITTLTYNATYVSGGSNTGPLFCNGTNWTAH